jgi:hypothetical protein
MQRVRHAVGLLTLVAAAAAAVWIVRLLRGIDERPGVPLRVEFRDARGLRPGAFVRYRGVTVGTVRAVGISPDGAKAVAHLHLDPTGAEHARVASAFWIVTPRFAGLTDGATGLDTLVRDSYIAFQTPPEAGTQLTPGSLIVGRELPPASGDSEGLEEIEHGDLLMTLMVPENHGLRSGSAVVFRGVQTGDVRRVSLAPAGTHVEVELRIANRYRQTVTDRAQFWVARPTLSGALFSGFTLSDISSLLTPFVGYYGEPGKGLPVQNGYRAAAAPTRPGIEPAPVPAEALRQPPKAAVEKVEALVIGRVSYSAIERDFWSPDDPIHRQGSGLLFRDASGRLLVATARSLVDGSYTERDLFGGDPEIDEERIQVQLAGGIVLRAGRIWVDPGGADLALLSVEDGPPDLVGTPGALLDFEASTGGELVAWAAAADGAPLPAVPFGSSPAVDLGAAVAAGRRVVGVVGVERRTGKAATIPLQRLPADLRPR